MQYVNNSIKIKQIVINTLAARKKKEEKDNKKAS